LWENKIAIGDLTLISGDGGVGKSYFACHLAAHVNNGKRWADGTPCEQGAVLFFPIEGKEGVFKRRLVANGVDLDKCLLLKNSQFHDKKTKTFIQNNIQLGQLTAIEKAIDDAERTTGLPVRLVVVDPVGNFFGNTNVYLDSEVRKVLMPLQDLAEKKNVAILLVAHHGKGKRSASQNQTLGSVALVNTSRAVWQVYRDQQDKDLRYFAPSKTNDCIDPTAVSFCITKPEGRVQIVDTDIDKTADDLMNESKQETKRGRKPTKLEAATTWLGLTLANGAKPFQEIRAAWEASEDFSEDTVYGAAENLRVRKWSEGFGKNKVGYWGLPIDGE